MATTDGVTSSTMSAVLREMGAGPGTDMGVGVGGSEIAVGVGGKTMAVGVGGSEIAVGVGGKTIAVGVGVTSSEAHARIAAAASASVNTAVLGFGRVSDMGVISGAAGRIDALPELNWIANWREGAV